MCIAMFDNPFFVRNFTFGMEDSLISTTGVLLGLYAAKFTNKQILVAGFILVLVEASSMAYGALLSDENFVKTETHTHELPKTMVASAVTMFVSYFVIGMVLLAPFALNLPRPEVWVTGVAIALLFGLIRFFESSLSRSVLLAAIGVAVMVGSAFVGNRLKLV